MEFVNELFEKYEIRKNKKQKTQFIEWVKGMALDKGWAFNVEKGSFGTRNIVIGDVDKAKIVFTAHYDTCAVLPFPNFITPKNFLVYLIYQIFICLVIFVPMWILQFIGFVLLPDYFEIVNLLSSGVLLLFVYLIMFGPANKHTANDNTSGVATILGLLNEFKSTDDVALVLFDFEEIGLVGSSSFASKHKAVMKDKILINFDCVSDGRYMLFVLNKKTSYLVGDFKESFVSNKDIDVEIVTKGVFYPSDQACFKKGIGVCALKKNKIFKSGYMDRIHTIKDTVFRKENIEFLVDGSRKLYNLISK